MATIVELCLSTNCGGMEIYIERISRALSQRGHRVQVITSAGSYLAQRLPPALNYPLASRGIHDVPRLMREITHKIASEKADVVHVHGGRELPYAVLAKLRCRQALRVIYSRHIVINKAKKDPWHRLLYRHVHAYLAISAQIRDKALRYMPIPAARVHLLHHGVQLTSAGPEARAAARSRLGIDGNVFLVGAFSRLEYEKGQHTLIGAAELLYRSGIDARLLIIGHAAELAYKESLIRRVRALKMEARVMFLDFLPEAHSLMSACDAVVVASKIEGFGLVVIEAMAASVPVVGTRRAGGMLDLIEHGENGLSFDWEDESMLAEQLRALYQDANLRARLASNGHSFARRHFDFEDHLDALEARFFG